MSNYLTVLRLSPNFLDWRCNANAGGAQCRSGEHNAPKVSGVFTAPFYFEIAVRGGFGLISNDWILWSIQQSRQNFGHAI